MRFRFIIANNPVVWAALATLTAAGCADVEPPAFRLNMVSMVSNELGPEYQQEVANVLGGLFGTPDEPFAHPATGLDQIRLDQASGPAWTDEAGVNRGLYRKHCVHCHGISGDGRGPTSPFLNPYPRDYRKGIFKFNSTGNGKRPTDDDLRRVLINGVPGTSMPSLALLPSSEQEALVEYVKYLALRGEVETELSRYVFDELGETEQLDENDEEVLDDDGNPVLVRIPLNPAEDADQRDAILGIVESVAEEWASASENVIHPFEEAIPKDNRTEEEVAASIAKGRELFYGTKANCIKCHGPTGLGDGQRDDQNIWNKEVKQFLTANQDMARSIERRANTDPPENESDEKRAKRLERLARDRQLLANRREVAETLLPVRNAIPRNLRAGIYRGGRRRIDIYWKIHAGISGTPMPGLGSPTPGQGTITDEEMWNIVDYVLSLPYEAPSRPQRALLVNEQPIVN